MMCDEKKTGDAVFQHYEKETTGGVTEKGLPPVGCYFFLA